MKLLTECTSADCLQTVTGIVHDCLFNVTTVTFDQERGIVRVPFSAPEGVLASWFSFLRRWRKPTFLLEIGRATSMRCDDAQGIQTYNFNAIEHRDGLVMIRTGIPTTFHVNVDELQLRVFDARSSSA